MPACLPAGRPACLPVQAWGPGPSPATMHPRAHLHPPAPPPGRGGGACRISHFHRGLGVSRGHCLWLPLQARTLEGVCVCVACGGAPSAARHTAPSACSRHPPPHPQPQPQPRNTHAFTPPRAVPSTRRGLWRCGAFSRGASWPRASTTWRTQPTRRRGGWPGGSATPTARPRGRPPPRWAHCALPSPIASCPWDSCTGCWRCRCAAAGWGRGCCCCARLLDCGSTRAHAMQEQRRPLPRSHQQRPARLPPPHTLPRQCVGFMALALYLDAVLPDANGVRLPPWFLLQPGYWFPGRVSALACVRACVLVRGCQCFLLPAFNPCEPPSPSAMLPSLSPPMHTHTPRTHRAATSAPPPARWQHPLRQTRG